MEEKRDVSKAESFTRQPYNSICVPAQSDVDVLTENVNKGDGLKGLTSAENTGSIMFSIKDQIGHLADAIKVFQENEVKVIHIESRRSRRRQSEFDIFVDVRVSSLTLDQLVCKLRSQVPGFRANDVTVTCMTPTDKHGCKENLSWFPRAISDLDHFANRVLMYGSELDADHPGFKDNTYRQRRTYFANIAKEYQYGKPIPRIEYTEEEVKTWGTVYRELTKLYPTHACCEYLDNLPLLIEHCGFREDNLPQLEDVSQFLQARTGFRLRPVAGYLSSRDFLAGLAFRMFHCTQYIRHSSDPFYTPEPDCCHELLGHMPLLADPSFAEFSQEIGLASLGASDAEVQKLATCYFFTIEFGLCKQDGSLRAYGAGLLSSIGELKHALSDKAEKMAFEPAQTCRQECLITTFQDVYFFTESFEEAKERMRQFASTIRRPFSVKYNPYTQNVEILNNIPSIASMVNVVKGELAVISDALNKLQTPSKEPKSSQPNGSTMKDPLIH